MKKILLFILLFATSCTPYIDYRHEPNQPNGVGTATSDRAAICYNAWLTNQKEVNDLAVYHCSKTRREPVFISRDTWSCRLFTPQRVYYKCVENPELSEYDLTEDEIILRQKEQRAQELDQKRLKTLW